MAIDVPQSIISSFKRSSNRSKWKLWSWRRTARKDKCACSFPDCKECADNRNGYNSNSSNNNYRDCGEYNPESARSLLEANITQTELTLEDLANVTDWKLRDEESQDNDVFATKYWKKQSKANRKFYKKRRDDEKLLSQKDTISRKKRKVGIFLVIAVVLMVTAILIQINHPVGMFINWQMALNPNTIAFWLWKAPPVALAMTLHVFNVSNPQEFLAGKEKMRLQELGPFVYLESVENTNPVFHENGTLTYIPRKVIKFAPELSVGDPKKMYVSVPNIPYVGIASMLSNASMFTNLGLLTMTRYLNTQVMLNITIHDYFWGYKDPLVKAANTLIASWIPFPAFGILDRFYDEGHNVVNMRLKDNGLDPTDERYLPQYSINTWNGSPGLWHWGYKEEEYIKKEKPLLITPKERCKYVYGTTEGVIFPRHMSPNVTFYIYRKSFCRIMPLEHDYTATHRSGLKGAWLKFPDDVFDTPEQNPAQQCYCDPRKTKCMPKGLSDITPCYYGIPTAVSFPHLYKADPELLTRIDGLKPDKKKHDTYAVVQPDFGTPLELRSRTQLNLVVSNLRYNSKLMPFSNLVIPIAWFELGYDGLPWYASFGLYMFLNIIPVTEPILVVIFLLVSVYLMLHSLVLVLLMTGLLQVSRHYGRRYSSVSLSPAVNKNNIVNLSRRSSLMTGIGLGRKDSAGSVTANHKPLVTRL